MGYARKDVEKTKKIAKKFVRYQEGQNFERCCLWDMILKKKKEKQLKLVIEH